MQRVIQLSCKALVAQVNKENIPLTFTVFFKIFGNLAAFKIILYVILRTIKGKFLVLSRFASSGIFLGGLN